jgi:predicted nucleotidyltransferase
VLIERGQRFADMEAKEVRKLLRRWTRWQYFERPPGFSEAVWEKLLADGMVAVAPDYVCTDGEYFTVKTPGFAFANARIGKPITRERAEKLLEEVIQRAEAINAVGGWVRVERIRVFGSYVRGAKELGDLDLIADIKRPVGDEWIRMAKEIGRDKAMYIEDATVLRLKNRSPYISFSIEACLPAGAKAELQLLWEADALTHTSKRG